MDTSFFSLVGLVRETLSKPRAGAKRVMAIDLPDGARWEALALVIVLSVFLGQISFQLMGGPEGSFLASPVRSGALQGGLLVAVIFAVQGIGRALGGQGRLGEAVVIIAWLQFIMVCIQAVQIVLLVLLPPFASLLGVVGMVVFLWLLTNFIAELHGFKSLGKVFAAILAVAFAMAFFASMVLVPLGIEPPVME